MKVKPIPKIHIIGAGLAGAECALQLADAGIHINLYDMKPNKKSPAHKSDKFGELVCSNSLKNTDELTASGLFKAELKFLGCKLLDIAQACSVGAGGALAVDRVQFADKITERILTNKFITVHDEEITNLVKFGDNDIVVVATGPLTSESLSECIKKMLDENSLYFYDASAPIVKYDTIDLARATFMNRYDKGEPDYLNLDLTREEYQEFYEALITAEVVELKSFENLKVYEGCMPIEILAKRGRDAIRFGPMKPVGLKDKNGNTPYAAVQLRKENNMHDAYNMVGFQTNLKFGEQKRVFSMIPALKNAEFLRYGVMHRNTYINSPKHLNLDLSLKKHPNIYFAGQITGSEGYMESIAGGLYVAKQILNKLNNCGIIDYTNETLIGALFNYVAKGGGGSFEPMSVNYGLLAPYLDRVKDKTKKKELYLARSMQKLREITEGEK